jgi:hypothetical protein
MRILGTRTCHPFPIRSAHCSTNMGLSLNLMGWRCRYRLRNRYAFGQTTDQPKKKNPPAKKWAILDSNQGPSRFCMFRYVLSRTLYRGWRFFHWCLDVDPKLASKVSREEAAALRALPCTTCSEAPFPIFVIRVVAGVASRISASLRELRLLEVRNATFWYRA